MTQVAGALVRPRGFMVNVQSLEEALAFAQLIANTDMVPKDDIGKPGNILAKMQKGAEIGMPPMLSIGKLYIANGRVSMEVMGMMALVEGSGLLDDKKVERLKEEVDGLEREWCRATVKRKGREPHVVRFGYPEALKSGLLSGRNKDTYAKWDWRMYQNRALGFALQDEFADVLGGVVSLESMQDAGLIIEPRDGDIDVEPSESTGDEHLQNAAVEKMERLKLRPGQRLAKLTAYRGRMPLLIAELDKSLGLVPAQAATPPVEPPKAVEVETVKNLPEGVVGVEFDGVAHVAVVEEEAGPSCQACGARNYGNPECDTCLDVQIAAEEK